MRSLIVGFSFSAQGFSPMRKWTFGAGYNHPAVVLQPLFSMRTSSPYYSYLMFLGLVFTSQLKVVVRSEKNNKISMARLFKAAWSEITKG